MQTTTKWLSSNETQSMMPSDAWALVSHTGSLTQRLRDLTNNHLEFHFLNAVWEQAYPGETEKLGLPDNERTWIRNIEMSYQKKLWVIGRVVISENSITEKLKNVGASSIGDVLFKKTNLKHREFEFLLLDDKHPYYQCVPNILDTDKPIWARRSILYFENKPILIIEIFMPDIFCYAQ